MDFLQWIPWSISAVSLLFVILTYTRNGNKDKKEEEQEGVSKIDSIKESLLKVNIKLDQVCATTNESRTDLKTLSKDIQCLDTRISCLERDMKTVYKQIDELKNRG